MEQRTQEWLDARRRGVTATDIAAIMGISPWKTAWDVWMDKVHPDMVVENIDNEDALAWGREHEPDALRVWSALHPDDDISLVGIATRANSLGAPCIASPDALTKDYLLEFKCPFSLKIPDEVPIYYMTQCQWGMLVTNRPVCYLVYWTPTAYRFFEIRADDNIQEDLLNRADEFWNTNVLQQIEPTRDTQTINIEDIDDPEFRDSWNNVADEFARVSADLDALQERQKILRDELIQLAGGRKIRSPSVSFSTSWITGRRDYKGFCERNGVVDAVPLSEPTMRISVRRNK